MARTDLDKGSVKRQDGQISFEGGMNWIDAPNELQENESRLLVNCDIRRKDLEKAKGQRPFAEVEIGAEYYDRFFAGTLDSSKWMGYNFGSSSIAINDDFKLEVDAGAVTTTNVGVISTQLSPTVENAYMEFEITTNDTQGIGTGGVLNVYLGPNITGMVTNDGLILTFGEEGEISTTEDFSGPTDTSFDWDIDSVYRIRFQKKAVGWQICGVKIATVADVGGEQREFPIDPNDQVAELWYSGTFEGNVPSYLSFQTRRGTWLFDDVTYHLGFGLGTEKIPANGLIRFYRETAENQTIVMAFGNMYRYTSTNGFETLNQGLNPTARFSYRIFNDELICTNGVDRPFRYDGFNIFQLGAGIVQAPIASYIEVHLQSLFLAEGNSLFRNSPGNINVWDEFEPVVDVDAWQGDIIMGLVKLGSSLFIIKSSSVWELSGTLENNFVLRRVPGTRGCVAPYSIANDGKRVFFRGIDGVYLFDGLRTILMSYKIHPTFNNNVKSPFETTAFTAATDSVGVIHDFKYRLSVVQHGEPDVSFNNYEYVFDFTVNGNAGAWYARDRRNVIMYSSWDGEGDENELISIPSDTSNTLFELEVLDGNLRSDYTNCTINGIADTPFNAQWQSRNLIARGLTRDFLWKTWSPFRVLYNPYGEWHLGIRMTTMNNLPGQLKTLQQSYLKNSSFFSAYLDGGYDYQGPDLLADVEDADKPTNAFYLNDVDSILLSNFLEDDFVRDPQVTVKGVEDVSHKMGDANRGPECFLTLGQDQEVRTASGFVGDKTPTGLREAVGNFEPFRVTRVLVGVQEEARRVIG